MWRWGAEIGAFGAGVVGKKVSVPVLRSVESQLLADI